MSGHRQRVAVVGGGLAGITAALHAADAGFTVELFESTPRLGGLTHSFKRGERWVDNGQHVFLRCCTRYRALLNRLDVAHLVRLQPRLDITVRDGDRVGRLNRSVLPAPLHLATALARYPWLSMQQTALLARAALLLRNVDADDPRNDAQTFGAWLRRHGQRPGTIDAVWDLIGIATLNCRAEDASLAAAATVFQLGLLSDRTAADIGWSTVPLQRLHGDAATAALESAGVTIQLRNKVRSLAREGEGWLLGNGGASGAQRYDAVVLAVPPDAAEQLLPSGAVSLSSGWAAGLGCAPIVNVHAVFDRPVLDEPFVATVGSPAQWIFDRTEIAGEKRGQYLAVSVSAAGEFVGMTNAQLRQLFLPELSRILPRARSATVLDFFVTRERCATFRPVPGTAALRPQARTALPGLYLAGAWTATGWPATMESAVRSGESAAAALVEEWGGTSMGRRRIREVALS
ncbi:FAD-dependent oxidoreductase [Skermania sp. ID1734]|uniref:hydroxysqualene dehydroxylase HpnE n=1 Tax=Skermania sp. ID1734 TaxID=2597516 RepID=UPI00117E92F7|nr:hydroxysqualene dehydroxylase HpnE [Skermania sp. ID1734]TSE00328.1 FAD-dependent oxidoreductase [Skermania sp. ID1734]